ncbi:secretoglobin family 3A member 2 [Kogia breviceps]|uniref:secretoglobin family 3A member 2 n=1 Tax=Kogia breviceps TaxID=27615 RepID=UPI002795968E|nr:secretoglobin family 3A member 2 [Kogia breviceps]
MPDEDIETWDEAAVVKAIDQARGLMSKATSYRSPLFSWEEAKSSHRDTCKDNQQRKRAITMTARTQKATAFLINSLPLFVNKALPLPLDNVLSLMDPLKLLLKTLGISVDHLVEELRKCVSELGPEASVAVKKLLEALSYLV